MVASDTTRILRLPCPHGHRSLLLNKTNEDEKKCQPKPTSKAEAASFFCSEIVLGELVGTGAFCEVHDLHDVRLLRSKNNKCKRRQIETKEEEETKNDDQQREYIYQTCQDTMGNSRYVVKHLRPNLSSDRSYKVFNHARADCLREFEILSRLSHPNIVQLCGYNGGCIANNKYRENNISINPDPEHFFIVIEKLEETLTQRVRRWIHIKKRMTNDNEQQNNGTPNSTLAGTQQQLLPPFYVEKLRYARDIASALTHIHSLGMVFRDLKPDNVGISIDGTVKLFDFGLCRDLPKKSHNCSHRNSHSSSNSGSSNSNDYKRERETLYRMSTVGTRRYMSPEVISGFCYNQKTDVYSWSMVFFEILCLQKPFAKYNRSLHKILVCENHGRPYPSMDVPWNSRDLLKRAWSQNSFDRPTMREIYDELCPMIEIVEQQALPITERSLRAVLEISELFVFDNNDNCNNRMNPLDDVASPDLQRKYSSSSQKTTTTRLSVSTMIGSDIAPE